ncbi:MAG: D-3-phosphoglycerate dehydrogenase / 2-oxoglutarate reductase [Acidobacteriota bacterium]|jgi:D-3-phosphoglycerate dehydrogenase|nr:D-3-phosphoglycerate dehydrogenase / 2-oxoglutarate reductase [Acidobacteriota bacterium]
MPDIKIFIADDVNESGLEPLRSAGFVVEKRTGLKGEELSEALGGADGLVVRSETKVTAQLLEAAARLRVIGRAGVGVDNIDVPAATQRGVIVMNAPDGNTMTTAEHTLALLLALARRVPSGQASLKAGRWERKKFVGVELRGKTLGVVGLGRIGRVVASRALGFEMKVLAFDPFVAPEQLREQGVELATLEEVCARADFITVHTPLTPETRGIIGVREFARMKQGVRVINCARGGLIDERALYAAIKEGRVAGAALDVFEEEPPVADYPLIALEEVVATPHLGASTLEAQEGVAVIVAEQMRDFFLTGAVRGAVNVPAVGAQEMKALEPYLGLAERLGRFQAQLVDEPVRAVEIEYAGEATTFDAAPVTRSFLAGLLRNMSARVNVVNALLIAEERGIAVTVSHKHGPSGGTRAPVRTRVLTTAGEHTVAGALFGQQTDGRVTEIDSFRIEATPAGNMLLTRSSDVPGVIGRVGTILGDHGVNISRFHLGRRERGGEAMAVIETDAPLDEATLEELRAFEPVISARRIALEG